MGGRTIWLVLCGAGVAGVVGYALWAVRSEAADERAVWLGRLPTSGPSAVGAAPRRQRALA